MWGSPALLAVIDAVLLKITFSTKIMFSILFELHKMTVHVTVFAQVLCFIFFGGGGGLKLYYSDLTGGTKDWILGLSPVCLARGTVVQQHSSP